MTGGSAQVSLAELAERADEAARTATAIAQFTNTVDLGVADAYAIPAQSIGRRVHRGEQLVRLVEDRGGRPIVLPVDEIRPDRRRPSELAAAGGHEGSAVVGPRLDLLGLELWQFVVHAPTSLHRVTHTTERPAA